MDITQVLDLYDASRSRIKGVNLFLSDKRKAKAFLRGGLIAFDASVKAIEKANAEYAKQRFLDGQTEYISDEESLPDDKLLSISQEAITEALKNRVNKKTLVDTASSIINARERIIRVEQRFIEGESGKYYYNVLAGDDLKHADPGSETYKLLENGEIGAALAELGLSKALSYPYVMNDEYFLSTWIWVTIAGKPDPDKPSGFIKAEKGILFASSYTNAIDHFLLSIRKDSPMEKIETMSFSEFAEPVFEYQLSLFDNAGAERKIVYASEHKTEDLYKTKANALRVRMLMENKVSTGSSQGKEVSILLSDWMSYRGVTDRKWAKKELIDAGDALRANLIYTDKNGKRINTEYLSRSEYIPGAAKKPGLLKVTFSDDAYRMITNKSIPKVKYSEELLGLSDPLAFLLAVAFMERHRQNVNKNNASWNTLSISSLISICGLSARENKRAVTDIVTPLFKAFDCLKKQGFGEIRLQYPAHSKEAGRALTDSEILKAKHDYSFFSGLNAKLMKTDWPDYSRAIENKDIRDSAIKH